MAMKAEAWPKLVDLLHSKDWHATYDEIDTVYSSGQTAIVARMLNSGHRVLISGDHPCTIQGCNNSSDAYRASALS